MTRGLIFQETRIVDGYEVEIVGHHEMTAPQAGGYAIFPGVRITVRSREPMPVQYPDYDAPWNGFDEQPTKTEYEIVTYAERIFGKPGHGGAPGRYVHYPEMRNQIGRLGAYKFEWLVGDELEQWLQTRIDRMIAPLVAKRTNAALAATSSL